MVDWDSLSWGQYYIVVRHRNHLAIMSKLPVALSGSSTLYDFTTGLDKAYRTGAMKGLGTGGTAPFGLYAGNAANTDITINAADRLSVKNALGSTIYTLGDVDLSVNVNAADRLMVKNNLGQGLLRSVGFEWCIGRVADFTKMVYGPGNVQVPPETAESYCRFQRDL